MKYETLNVRPETKRRFRAVGNRGESDDTVINQLIDLHNELTEDMETLDKA